MFEKIENSYNDAVELLGKRGISVSAATDDYVTKVAGSLIPVLIEEKELDLLRSIFLLRGADVCATRNLNLPIVLGRFDPKTTIEVKDIQIAEFTSICHCLRRRKCHVPKNHVAYVATFSGEAERLRFLKSEVATDISYSYKTGESLLKALIEKYGELPSNMRALLEIKSDIWVALSKLIGLSPAISKLKLEDGFE